jgi:hypothetical protein
VLFFSYSLAVQRMATADDCLQRTQCEDSAHVMTLSIKRPD